MDSNAALNLIVAIVKNPGSGGCGGFIGGYIVGPFCHNLFGGLGKLCVDRCKRRSSFAMPSDNGARWKKKT